MADQPGQPSSSATERGTPLNANGGRANFERLNPATGQVKDVVEDLLREVCECLEDQTDNLIRRLEKLQKSMRDGLSANRRENTKELRAIQDILLAQFTQLRRESRGGGGSGGGGSPGDRDRRDRREREESEGGGILGTIMGNLGAAGSSLLRLDIAGALRELTKGLDLGAGRMGALATAIGAATTAIASFTAQAKDSIKLAYTGIDTATNLFTDQFEQVVNGISALWSAALTDQTLSDAVSELRDNILQTGRELREMATEGAATNLLLDGNKTLEEAAAYLRQVRDSSRKIEDVNFRNVMSDEKAREATLEILELQKRAGVQGDIAASEAASIFAEQTKMLTSISMSTGLTVDELRKQTAESRKAFARAEALGAISSTDNKTLQSLSAQFINSPAIQELLGKFAQSGLDPVAFMAKFPELGNAFARAGATGDVEEILEAIRSGDDKRAGELLQNLNALGDRIPAELVKFTDLFEPLAGIISEAGLRVEPKSNEEVTNFLSMQNDTIQGMWETTRDLLKQFLPGSILGSINFGVWTIVALLGGRKILDGIKAAGSMAGTVTKGLLSGLGKILPGLMKGGAVAGAGFVGFKFGEMYVKPAFDRIVQNISGDWNATLGTWLYDSVRPVIVGTWEAAVQNMSDFFLGIHNHIKGKWDAVVADWTNLKETVGGVITGVFEKINEKWGMQIKAVFLIFAELRQKFGGVIDFFVNVIEYMRNRVTQAIEGIAGIFSNIANKVTGVFTDLKNKINNFSIFGLGGGDDDDDRTPTQRRIDEMNARVNMAAAQRREARQAAASGAIPGATVIPPAALPTPVGPPATNVSLLSPVADNNPAVIEQQKTNRGINRLIDLIAEELDVMKDMRTSQGGVTGGHNPTGQTGTRGQAPAAFDTGLAAKRD